MINKKKRFNAIKRVASKDKLRPAIMGYGLFGEYKGVTDSYHAIMIKQSDMPIPLSTEYPNLMQYFNYNHNINNGEELTLDINDLKEFIKANKGNKMALYKMGNSNYQARFIKNIIDIIGTDCKIYYQGGIQPLYFVNDVNEMGLVLPVIDY